MKDIKLSITQKYILGGFILALQIAFVAVSLGLYYGPSDGSNNHAEIIKSIQQIVLSPSKQHILITGGAGFIGSHAALLLAEKGHSITVLDNISRGNLGAIRALQEHIPAERFSFINIDLGDRPLLCDVLGALNTPVDVIIHFAAIAYVAESKEDPMLYFRNVTSVTTNLLSCMDRAKAKKMVYSSTCAVYGNPPHVPVSEVTPARPINPYGESKLMSENIIRTFARNNPWFEAVILRYFNVYGSDPEGRLGESPRPELRKFSRISNACMDVGLGLIDELVVTGTKYQTPDGTCVRDYIHVTDLVRAHAVAMSATSNNPRLFNIGTGKGTSVLEFVEACRRVTGLGSKMKVRLQKEPRAGDYAELYANSAKIKELGWSPQYVNITEGLAHAWAWRQAHPHGYSNTP